MILSVSIGDVDITYDDDCEDRPTPQQLDAALTIIRLNAINAWMAMPTILDTDADLNQVDLEAEAEATTEGDA